MWIICFLLYNIITKKKLRHAVNRNSPLIIGVTFTNTMNYTLNNVCLFIFNFFLSASYVHGDDFFEHFFFIGDESLFNSTYVLIILL